MAWVQLSSVSVTAGSKIVVIDVGSTANIKPGDGLQIAGFELYEVEGVFASQLTLKNAWNNASQTNMAAVIVPTFGDFNTAIEALRTATTTTHGNFAAMEQWWTESADIIFEDYEGNQHTVRSAKKMDADVAALEQQLNDDIMAVSTTYVMTEAQSQAIRKQNQELYAASDFVHHGKHYAASLGNINEGLWCWGTPLYPNSLWLGHDETNPLITGNSKTGHPVFNINGVVTCIRGINSVENIHQRNRLLLPPAPDGTVTYDSADGTVAQHADAATAFATETTTNKVVTERVDLVGLEVWDEEITDDEVFPHTIQNQSTTFGGTGVPTVLSSRPDSYFQVYDGQTGISKGRCVLWTTLSEEEKRQVAAYLGASFFIGKNGLLVQRRVRQRSIAGAGNGDWDNVASYSYLRFTGLTRVKPQGARDSITSSLAPYNINETGFYASHDDFKGDHDFIEQGVNIAHNQANTGLDSNLAYNGNCYFYVVATVPRLNQGAFHPSLNPMGAGRFRNSTGDIDNGWPWYSGNAHEASTKSECFTEVTFGNGRGDIAGALPGRDDGKYYDAIYASGQGGVIDHRPKYGAWDASSAEQAAVVREEVKNGTYRGREELIFTRPLNAVTVTNWNISASSISLPASTFSASDIGKSVTVYDSTNGKIKTGVIYNDNTIHALYPKQAGDGTGITINDVVYIMVHNRTSITVEGQFTQDIVLAHPTEVLENSVLKNGWLGVWSLTLPDNQTDEFNLVGKALAGITDNTHTTAQRTDNNGDTWENYSTYTITPSLNTVRSTNQAITRLTLVQYTAFAKQTTQSTKKALCGGLKALSPVFDSIWYDVEHGALLAESTLGLILKSGGTAVFRSHTVLSASINSDGLLVDADNYRPEYAPLILSAPNNNSHGVKTLFHQIEENGQTNLNIIANEIIYDTTAGNWGDDSTMKILNGTFPDDNGKTCKAAIHKLSKPYGWIKNDI